MLKGTYLCCHKITSVAKGETGALQVWRLLSALERVNQIKLQTVQPGFDLTGLESLHQRGILQVGVERPSVPPGKVGHRIGAQFIQRVETVLQNVGRRPLITLGKGSQHRILFLSQVSVSDLQIVLVFHLPHADIRQVDMRLLAQVGGQIPGEVNGMFLGRQVVFIFQQQVQRQAAQAGLNLVVEDEIGVEERRQKVRFATGIEKRPVRHAVGRKGTGRETRQFAGVRSRRAPGTFARNRQRRNGGGGAAAAGGGGLYGEGRGLKNRIRVAPVQNQERRRGRPPPHFQLARYLSANRERVRTFGHFVKQIFDALQGDILHQREVGVER